MATTTTTTITASVSVSDTFTEKTTTPTMNRPRRSSKAKHLNLWRDIDSAPATSSSHSPPSALETLVRKYTPAPIKARLDSISAQTYDLIIATFFSALAIVVLSVLFIGPKVEFITSIMGTYALGFGLSVGAWEVMRIVKERNGRGEGTLARSQRTAS